MLKKEQIQLGMPVIYWGVIKQNGEKLDRLDTHITSLPWELGHGEWVCKVDGKMGGVSLKHLDHLIIS